MRPPRDVAHPIHDLLARRWSPRAFAERAVEPEKLRSVLEAARWAPSSFNGQPWSFLVATQDDPADYERMLGCLIEWNQQWAKSAPVLMISLARNAFEHNAKPNRHAFYDVGAAVACLTIEATSLGLAVHQMAGFEPEKVRERYGVPESFEPVSAIALGYVGDANSLSRRGADPSQAGAWGKPPGR